MAILSQEQRTKYLAILKALITEAGEDCAGIESAHNAQKAAGMTPEADAAWAQKLAEYQERKATLEEMSAYFAENSVEGQPNFTNRF